MKMIEDLYYLDEGQVKITAASVGISHKRWISILESEVPNKDYKKLMQEGRFDILPIISGNQLTSEYFKTAVPDNYANITQHKITYRDILPLDTSIREVIKGFAADERRFYFLTYHHQITGLITIGNLNCRQVQVYLFGLICELERALTDFIRLNLKKDALGKYITERAVNNSKFNQIIDNYNKLVEQNLENKILEHLYFCDLLNIIKSFGSGLQCMTFAF